MAWETCVWCGKGFNTDSSSAMELGMGDWACSRSCWENAFRAHGGKMECEYCGETFDVWNGYTSTGSQCSEYDNMNAAFCSKKCFELKNGFNCRQCGTRVRLGGGYIIGGYCSRDCYQAAHPEKQAEAEKPQEKAAPASQPAQAAAPQEKKPVFRCQYCGKDFDEGGTIDEKSSLRFCCLGHKAAFKRECAEEYEEACSQVEGLHQMLQQEALDGSAEYTVSSLLEIEGWYHNPQIQYMISMKYRDEKKYELAFEWAKKSASQDWPNGMARLAWHYKLGKGCEKDAAKAISLARKAAEKDCVSAFVVLGGCYEEGTGVEKNAAMAFNWYKKAADKGYANGCYNVGRFFEDGIGVQKDIQEAILWYGKAAEKGVEYAAKQKQRLEAELKK